jgi:hypothetical protein
MSLLKSQKGQMTLEAVLLMVIGVTFVTVASESLKRKNVLGTLVAEPWGVMQGMIQNSIWAPAEAGSSDHPNVYGRRASPKPL